MKNKLFILLVLFCLTEFRAQNYTICLGSTINITANNVNGLTNPVYSIQPGGNIQNSNPSFTVSPSASTTYTLYTTGTNSNSAVVTTTSSSFVEVSFVVIDTTIVPRQILNCSNLATTLTGVATGTSLTYMWTGPGGISVPGSSLVVNANTIAPTTTLTGNYTLTISNASLCSTRTIVPIYQCLYPPIAKISGTTSLTCNNPTVQLLNNSFSGIPGNSIFPNNLPVIGFEWQGPISIFNSTTYTASVAGTYTLIAKDLNNDCRSTATIVVTDNRVYPIINTPVAPPPGNLCGNYAATLTPIISSPTLGLMYLWTSPANATVSGISGPKLVTNALGVYTLSVTSPQGCRATVTMEVIYCVGYEETHLLSASVFPNPAETKLNITLPFFNDIYFYQISNLQGQNLLRGEIKDGGVDISNLQAGMYTILITFNRGSAVSRFIKK